jgi:NTE family protein
VSPDSPVREIAFVLGGGGVLGAHEVGMLRALAEHGIRPDVVLGTSVGAINGAFFAADPTLAGVERLTELWRAVNLTDRSPGTVLRRVTTLARSGTHLQSLTEMRDRLTAVLPVRTVEELSIPFQCVAASIERAAEHWFDSGPLADVVLASCAVPGILPPVPIGDEHFIDGGIVNSIPVSRAVTLGARRIYVLQVGGRGQ